MKNIDTVYWFKSVKLQSLFFFCMLLAASIAIGIMSHSYFHSRVFYMELNKYSQASEHDDIAIYTSDTAAPIQVRSRGEQRIVTIESTEYAITKLGSTYEVHYPGGKRYKVIDQNGALIAFNEQGEWISGSMAYSNGERILSEGEERYPPSTLVAAAYRSYHSVQGDPEYLYLALGCMIYGWCGFRYRKVQDFFFSLPLNRLWYKDDPEPSDLYYFVCKAGGIVFMIASVFIAFKAY